MAHLQALLLLLLVRSSRLSWRLVSVPAWYVSMFSCACVVYLECMNLSFCVQIIDYNTGHNFEDGIDA